MPDLQEINNKKIIMKGHRMAKNLRILRVGLVGQFYSKNNAVLFLPAKKRRPVTN